MEKGFNSKVKGFLGYKCNTGNDKYELLDKYVHEERLTDELQVKTVKVVKGTKIKIVDNDIR